MGGMSTRVWHKALEIQVGCVGTQLPFSSLALAPFSTSSFWVVFSAVCHLTIWWHSLEVRCHLIIQCKTLIRWQLHSKGVRPLTSDFLQSTESSSREVSILLKKACFGLHCQYASVPIPWAPAVSEVWPKFHLLLNIDCTAKFFAEFWRTALSETRWGPYSQGACGLAGERMIIK